MIMIVMEPMRDPRPAVIDATVITATCVLRSDECMLISQQYTPMMDEIKITQLVTMRINHKIFIEKCLFATLLGLHILLEIKNFLSERTYTDDIKLMKRGSTIRVQDGQVPSCM
jgi:hypothetical protein